jgi:hypothetical protein
MPIRNCYKDALRPELFHVTFGNNGDLRHNFVIVFRLPTSTVASRATLSSIGNALALYMRTTCRVIAGLQYVRRSWNRSAQYRSCNCDDALMHSGSQLAAETTLGRKRSVPKRRSRLTPFPANG